MRLAHRLDAAKRLAGAAACRVFVVAPDASAPLGPAPSTTRMYAMISRTLGSAALALLATASSAAVAILATVGFADPAYAGECAAGQMAANSLADAPTMPKGVTDTVIGSVDLGS